MQLDVTLPAHIYSFHCSLSSHPPLIPPSLHVHLSHFRPISFPCPFTVPEFANLGMAFRSTVESALTEVRNENIQYLSITDWLVTLSRSKLVFHRFVPIIINRNISLPLSRSDLSPYIPVCVPSLLTSPLFSFLFLSSFFFFFLISPRHLISFLFSVLRIVTFFLKSLNPHHTSSLITLDVVSRSWLHLAPLSLFYCIGIILCITRPICHNTLTLVVRYIITCYLSLTDWDGVCRDLRQASICQSRCASVQRLEHNRWSKTKRCQVTAFNIS